METLQSETVDRCQPFLAKPNGLDSGRFAKPTTRTPVEYWVATAERVGSKLLEDRGNKSFQADAPKAAAKVKARALAFGIPWH